MNKPIIHSDALYERAYWFKQEAKTRGGEVGKMLLDRSSQLQGFADDAKRDERRGIEYTRREIAYSMLIEFSKLL
jgi:rRNA pseudouridine-1189 N-methylase Emg1 (Nep1/Mra1 family)